MKEMYKIISLYLIILSIAFVLIVFGLFFVFFFTMKDPNGVREQELSNINIGGLIEKKTSFNKGNE